MFVDKVIGKIIGKIIGGYCRGGFSSLRNDPS